VLAHYYATPICFSKQSNLRLAGFQSEKVLARANADEAAQDAAENAEKDPRSPSGG
jgi:hypothetical protein